MDMNEAGAIVEEGNFFAAYQLAERLRGAVGGVQASIRLWHSKAVAVLQESQFNNNNTRELGRLPFTGTVVDESESCWCNQSSFPVEPAFAREVLGL